MAIEVRCPNGHRLKCPDDRAGRRGKCPKCGASFKVSANGQAEDASAVAASPAAPSPETSQVTAASDSGKQRIRDAAAETKINFHCPQGHKLSGPASLQGQPGQCPHCQTKFLIPRLYDADQQQQAEASQQTDLSLKRSVDEETVAEPVDDEFLGIDELQEVEQGSSRGSDAQRDAGFLPGATPPPEFLTGPAPDIEPTHPLAGLFVTLWLEHEHGAVVEVHLASGVIIVPDWWAPALSMQSHGVFAIQTTDGSYVMETVAWDAIQRITIRRIQELPGGVFE